MECPYCKVEITFNSEVCPLCHMPLKEKKEETVEVYPKKRRAKKLFTPSAEKLYIFCSLYAFALCVLLNIRYFTGFPWSAIVCVVLIAGFFVMKAVYISKSKLHGAREPFRNTFRAFLKRFFHF